MRLDPTYAGARLGLGRIELAAGIELPPAGSFGGGTATPIGSTQAAVGAGQFINGQRRHAAALGCLKWLVSVKPDLTNGWLNLAVVQFKRKLYEDGIASCQTALANEPANVLAMYNLALAYEHKRDYEISLSWVRQARRLDANEMGLQRLEFRLRFLILRNQVAAIIRRVTSRFS